MCTALFAFGLHTRLLFFLTFNRDEFFDRPTTQAHWWQDDDEILAGRDELRKGTWLAFSRKGRFAFLTNFREVQYHAVDKGQSRGELPISFIKSGMPPLQFLHQVNAEAQNGFNLVVGDLVAGKVAYLTNRDSSQKSPVELEPGLYGLSNGILSSRWPKVERGKELVKEVLEQRVLKRDSFPWRLVFDNIMHGCDKVEDPSRLPQTGLGEEVEHALSSILIQPMDLHGRGLYGTRTQTVVAAWEDDSVELQERTLPGKPDAEASTVSFQFKAHVSERFRQQCEAEAARRRTTHGLSVLRPGL